MAGFEDLIRGTLQKHGDATPQSRASIYDSSRQALERMLSQNKSLDLAAQSLQRQRLEKAIADIEASYASKPAQTGSAASPSPSAPPAPTATETPAPTAQPAQPAPPPAAPAPTPPAPTVAAQPPQPVATPASPAPTVTTPVEPPQVAQPQSPPQAPPPIPVFRAENSPPAGNAGRVEPGFDVPPIPVPPTVQPAVSSGATPAAAPPVPQASQSPAVSSRVTADAPPSGGATSGGPDAYSEAVEASQGNGRKPYAKLLLWTIIIVGIGVSFWWAINFGPALLKQQLGGSVPNPGQTIESGQFLPGDNGGGEGWVMAFNPADDSINIETGGRGTAEVFQNENETFVRLASNAGGNDNNLKVLIPRGVMLPLKGSAATIEVLLKGSEKAAQEFAVYCEFGSMGSCGRKRFTAPGRPDAQIFDVLINNVELAANEEAYLTFNTDLGAEGRGIDIYGIRVRLNR